MSLLLLEGFDWLETADLPAAYGAFDNVQPTGTMTQTIEGTGGRNGGKSIKIIPGTGGSDELLYNVQGKGFDLNIAAGAEVIFGFAVKFNVVQEQNRLAFATISNGAGGVTDNNLTLIRFVDGTIGAGWHATATHIGAIGKTILNVGVWYYIECKFISDASVGELEVRVNGRVEFDLSSMDTTNANDTNDTLIIGSTIPVTVIPEIEFDDLYICDGNGSRNNDFLGDIVVERLDPDGNGNTSNFTGSDADSTDNYLLVDDGPAPDDDTTYTEDNVSTNKDLYTYDNLSAAIDDVKAVGIKTLGKKVDGGAADLKAVVRSNVTETDSAALGLTTAYTAKQAIYEIDPNTSTDWTTGGVDAMEAGVKVE